MDGGVVAGEGWMAVGAWSKEGQVGSSRGQGLGGESKGFGSGRVGVLFFESWRVDLVTCSRRGLPRAVWGSGKGWLGGARARGGGPRGSGGGDGANFASCVVFLSFLTRTKRRKMAFFEGCLWGGGGYPPELAWWTGG